MANWTSFKILTHILWKIIQFVESIFIFLQILGVCVCVCVCVCACVCVCVLCLPVRERVYIIFIHEWLHYVQVIFFCTHICVTL